MAYNAISDFVLDQIFGYQTATKIKNNIEAALAARLERNLGGSRINSVLFNGTFDVHDYRDVEIDATKLGGLTVRARVEGRTTDSTTSVTPRIRNITDSTTLVTGTAITSTTFVEQLLTMAVTGANKKYRLQGTTNNGNNDVFLFGVVETFA